ncbi:MAG: DUF2231 domain-containing protein [Actinomycetes bacterium]
MTTTTQRQTLPAKQPISLAAGPYGHPFHPILVTLPIGAWICSLIFDISTRVNSAGSRPLTDASYWLIAIGLIGAVVAALFGLLDLLRIPRRTRALTVALTHMLLNLTVVGLFIGNFAWRHSSYYESAKVSGGQIVLSAVAVALLAASGWLGGMLAYRYGVRVADEATQAEGYR